MGEEREVEHNLCDGYRKVLAQRAEMTALCDPPAPWDQPPDPGQKARHREGADDEDGPRLGGGKRKQPTRNERGKRGGRHKRAAQIVHHLPACDGAEHASRPSALIAPPAEDPWQQLPVAAYPAILSCDGHLIARRKVLHDLDVGDEPGAREGAFQKVVAENRALRNPSLERLVKRVDVVDSLADIGS